MTLPIWMQVVRMERSLDGLTLTVRVATWYRPVLCAKAMWRALKDRLRWRHAI